MRLVGIPGGMVCGIVVLGASCWFGCCKEAATNPARSAGQYLPQTSAENCLQNLRTAYLERDLDPYSKLFTQDFVFVFPSDDIDELPYPPTWGRTDELEAHTHLFTSDLVDQIELSFQYESPVRSDDEFPGSWKVEMTEINLGLDTYRPDGTPLHLQVPAGHCTFYFRKLPGESAADGRPVWGIFRWVDRDQVRWSSGAVEQSTWGAIKAVFR